MRRRKETTITFDLTPSKLAEIRKVLDIPVGVDFQINTKIDYGSVYLSDWKDGRTIVKYTIVEEV